MKDLDASNRGVLHEGPNHVASHEPLEVGTEAEILGSSKKKERPTTILALINHAYSQNGRKLAVVAKDLRELAVQPAAAQEEVEMVRFLAARDPLFVVPPVLLATLAEHGADPLVRNRVLELTFEAFSVHGLFDKCIDRLADSQSRPVLTAQEVSATAVDFAFEASFEHEISELNETNREKLRINAVTAFTLFRVLRDRWTSRQFIDAMSALVWNEPKLSSVQRTSAVLVNAKSRDALSLLSRHFEELILDTKREAESAHYRTRQQELRAITAEAFGRKVSAELELAMSKSADLAAAADSLNLRLAAEQSNRVVDQSHHVDDYEALRTHVIRRLTRQIELLSKGLHALRNGSATVAEEFVDRAMGAIDTEVAHLKDLEGGMQ